MTSKPKPGERKPSAAPKPAARLTKTAPSKAPDAALLPENLPVPERVERENDLA
jgi:hypothetical protein